MFFEVAENRRCLGEWVVEAINYEGELGGDAGEIFAAIFSGPLAKERAEEYAGWKNKQGSFIAS